MLIELELPIMDIKWGRIKKNIPKISILNKNKEKIIKMRNDGKTLKEINNKLGTNSLGNLSLFLKNNNGSINTHCNYTIDV